MSAERSELETTITYDRGSPIANVFTAIKRDQGKLKRAGISPSYGNARRGFGYKVPLSRLKWRIASGLPSKRGLNLPHARNSASPAARRGGPEHG